MSKRILIAAIFLVVTLTGYWYHSPYVTMYGMRSAVRAADVEKFNSYVDYTRVRERLKGTLDRQIQEMVAEMTVLAEDGNTIMEAIQPQSLADELMDMMVQPGFLMHSMSVGKLESPVFAENGARPEPGEKEPVWWLERESADEISVRIQNPELTELGVGVILERTGFASWKMTGLHWAD